MKRSSGVVALGPRNTPRSSSILNAGPKNGGMLEFQSAEMQKTRVLKHVEKTPRVKVKKPPTPRRNYAPDTTGRIAPAAESEENRAGTLPSHSGRGTAEAAKGGNSRHSGSQSKAVPKL
jgi:hypothetical protein